MRRLRVHPLVLRGLQLALWAIIAVVAIRAGIDLRHWTWEATAPIRFKGDIGNAVAVASRTFQPPSASPRADDPAAVDWSRVMRGYLALYDREDDRAAQRNPRREGSAYSFDYPPGRLLAVTLWTAPVFVERGIDARYDDAFATPMLRMNLAHELVAAIGVFALVRRTFVRCGRGRFVAEAGGVAAALLAWFNPAAILNSHGWPQWDVWVLPYTIWAAYFGLSNRWIMAGVLLAAGAMLKGQVLLIAPLFALWPLFRFDVDAVLRLIAGFAATVALLMSPWLLRASPAQVSTLGVVALAILPIVWPRRWRFGPMWCALVALAAGWTLGPWLNPTPIAPSWWHAAALVLALAPLEWWRGWPFRAWIVPRLAILAWLCSAGPTWALGALSMRWPDLFDAPARTLVASAPTLIAALVGIAVVFGLSPFWRGHRAMWLAVVIAGAVTLAAIDYDGSIAWWRVGFQTDRYPTMIMGRTSNLPAILQVHFGLNIGSPIELFGLLKKDDRIELRPLLRGVAYGGVTLAALAMALQQKRRDANLLIAIPAAWAMLFAFMPQMHERYLVWAAVTSAVLVTRGIGGVLIYAALSAIQVAMLYCSMCENSRRGRGLMNNEWWRMCATLQPSSGYIVATLAVVLLVWSFRRSAPPRAVVAEAAFNTTDTPRVGA